MLTCNDLLVISNREQHRKTEQICYLSVPVVEFCLAMDRTLITEEYRPASRTANP
jgi:hypothetical protein